MVDRWHVRSAQMLVYKHLGTFLTLKTGPHISDKFPKLHPDACIQAPGHFSKLNRGLRIFYYRFSSLHPNPCIQAPGHISKAQWSSPDVQWSSPDACIQASGDF